MTKYEESPKVELKSELVDDVKHELLAFLNSHGGTIYIGVDNGGSVCPIEPSARDGIDSKLGNWIQEAFFPSPVRLIDHDYNDDGVLVIKVREGTNKPYYLKEKGPKPSGVYIRHGRSTRKASESEILGMILSSSKYSFEDDESDTQELSFRFFKEEMEENGLPFGDREMVSLGMRRTDGVYTNLALILSDQSPIQVKVAEYDEAMDFKVKKVFSGSLLRVLRDVREQCDRLNDVSAVIDGKTFIRKETASYPGSSLREAVLNAFCHANFFIRSNIKIEFFPSECRITNPGGVFDATLDDVLMGVQTYRNPRLVNVFYKLGYIENFGTGIPRIRGAYASSEEKPVFESSENFFFVRLPNLNAKKKAGDDEINDEINDEIKEDISDLGLAILRAVAKRPGIKAKDILEELSLTIEGITIDKVRNEIQRNLKSHIELVGSRKSGGYHIKR